MSLVLDPDSPTERVLVKSDAVCAIFDRSAASGGSRRWPAGCRAESATLPTTLVASRRYRWFGRFDECPLPSPELRARLAAARSHHRGTQRHTEGI